MAKFHSTLSRRDFMKALGIAGAGMGTAAATSPVFHDLEELAASDGKEAYARPWWVKETDMPTVEMDWSIIKPFNDAYTMDGGDGAAYLIEPDIFKSWQATAKQNLAEKYNKEPGWSIPDRALSDASSKMGFKYIEHCVYAPDFRNDPYFKYSGPSYGPSQTTDGNWIKLQATPEENAKIVRAALRFFGVNQARFFKLDEKMKKLVFTKTEYGTPIVYEDVERGYGTDISFGGDKIVIPKNKELWGISLSIPMSKAMFRQGTGLLRAAANYRRYMEIANVQLAAQVFFNGIGYQLLGYTYTAGGVMAALPAAIFTGMGELGRTNSFIASPENGTICGYFVWLTDLPLAVDKPIDCGTFKFCHTCQKCAEVCPTQCISYDKEPSWDIPRSATFPKQEPRWSSPGKKVFWRDEPGCFKAWKSFPGCGTCMGTCTFNTNTQAIVHDVVKATVSQTSLLNGMFWNADKFFGYGITPVEKRDEWWDHLNPINGYDNTIGSNYKGY
ncbi:reductive dehalogenase [Dehalococcoides mccartyi]|uniref:Reductive dehalogenase n=1 Tax=Dehalococcoides mccartyi (strain VS) TaxID=311424 RepID=D2BJC6_DEHMV|nr:reductive dehalogenase [Dehalococcoides mccartyi]ACZ62426.1 reductive dehalogenase [Dehalococcoides mccartyi VS]